MVSKKINFRTLLLGFCACVVFGVLVWLATFNADKGLLTLFSIDEFEELKYLFRMYDGFWALDPIRFLSCSGFVYGFGSYWVNFFVTFPFLALGDPTWVIFASRWVSGVFMMLMLVALYKFLPKYPIWGVIIMLTMPIFWLFGAWHHPDPIMMGLLAVALWFLKKDMDDGGLGRWFWWSFSFFVMSVATKSTAAMFLFTWVFYGVGSFLIKGSALTKGHKIKGVLSLVGKSLGLGIGLYLLICPYLIHPLGRYAMFHNAWDTLQKNATNHGLNTIVTYHEKIAAIQLGYGSIVLLFFGLLVCVFVIFSFLKSRKINTLFYASIAFSGLLSFLYFFFGVNKAWWQYYAPVSIFVLVGAWPLVCRLLDKQFGKLVLGLFCVVHVYLGVGIVYKVLILPEAKYAHYRVLDDMIIESLNPYITQESFVLISPKLGFSYDRLGLNDDQVRFIYGPLTKDMFQKSAFLEKWKEVDLERYPVRKFYRPDFIIIKKHDFDRHEDLLSGLRSGIFGYFLWKDLGEVVIFRHQFISEGT